MIDERELTGLLDELAATYEPPADGPERVAAAARSGRVPRSRLARIRPKGRPQWLLAAAAVFVVVAVAGALFGGGGGDRQAEFQAVGQPNAGVDTLQSQPRAAFAGGGGGDEASVAADVSGTGAGLGAPAPTALPQAGPDTARVIKTGSVEVEVPDGGFERAVSRLTSFATGLNGFVADSSTSEDEGGARGQVTIRVPAPSFEEALTEARRLGEVRNASVKGQDVSAEFTDLEARLRSLQATRDQFLTLLRQARTIPDILGVQDRINQVQLEIEQAQGRLNQLTDQTGFGTLSVVLFEEGADSPPRTDRSGLAEAWEDAKDGFVDGVEALVAGSGTGLFVLLVLAVLALGARGVWRLTRRRLV